MKQAHLAYRACILATDPYPKDAAHWALRQLGGYSYSLLAICTHSIRANGIEDIVLASAYQDAKLDAAAEKLGLRNLWSPSMGQDPLAGLRAVLTNFLQHQNNQTLLLLPVHSALVRSATITALLHQMEKDLKKDNSAPPVLCSSFLNQRGYPLLLPRHHARALLDQQGKGGLEEYLADLQSVALRPQWLPKQPVEAKEHGLTMLPLADIGITWQLNNEQALDQAEEYLYETEGRTLAGVEEAKHLLLQAKLPIIKLRHSVLVALGALRLGRALAQAKEKPLAWGNPLLHVGAGLLHDLVRYQRRHAETGARLLWQMGWPRIALVAGRHQQLPPPCLAFLGLPADPADTSTEALPFPDRPDASLLSATLCVNMADKYTQDDQQVPLATRFARVGKNCPKDQQVMEAMARRKEQSTAVALRLRQYCGADPLAIIARPSGHALEASLLALLRVF